METAKSVIQIATIGVEPIHEAVILCAPLHYVAKIIRADNVSDDRRLVVRVMP